MLRSPRDVALVVLAAIVLGLLGARFVPPRAAVPATPTPTPVVLSPTPTPEPAATPPRDDERVWEQPLAAGCALPNGEAIVVSAGGGIARFDGKFWTLIDDVLRQMRAVACASGVAFAVGDAGRLVQIDTSERTVRADVVADVDLWSVSALDGQSAWAGGTDLTVLRLGDGAWSKAGSGGGGGAWRAVLVRSAKEVWVAGDLGLLYVWDGSRFVDRSLTNGPDLNALAAVGDETFVGAHDGSIFAVKPTGERRLVSRVAGPVLAMAPAAKGFFVLANELRLFNASGPLGAPLVHGLSCPPVAIFGTGAGELWVIGRDGARAGVARLDGDAWRKTGRC